MCRCPRRVFTVCCHVEELREEKCDIVRKAKQARQAKRGALRRWLETQFTEPRCRLKVTLQVEYGWCAMCVRYYLPWNVKDKSAILNYWAHKNKMGYKRAVDPSLVPADVVFSIDFRYVADPRQTRCEITSLLRTMIYCGFPPSKGSDDETPTSYLEGLLEATVEWSQWVGRRYPPDSSSQPGRNRLDREKGKIELEKKMIEFEARIDREDPWDERIDLHSPLVEEVNSPLVEEVDCSSDEKVDSPLDEKVEFIDPWERDRAREAGASTFAPKKPASPLSDCSPKCMRTSSASGGEAREPPQINEGAYRALCGGGDRSAARNRRQSYNPWAWVGGSPTKSARSSASSGATDGAGRETIQAAPSGALWQRRRNHGKGDNSNNGKSNKDNDGKNTSTGTGSTRSRIPRPAPRARAKRTGAGPFADATPGLAPPPPAARAPVSHGGQPGSPPPRHVRAGVAARDRGEAATPVCLCREVGRMRCLCLVRSGTADFL
ncbi:hypothetical protein QBC33DRAFT_568413 [Phialemonium atrogriseum]|uniref:Uncharacterized protein n=1 Tax=Phialemonium atrogriseum TaxID=1093897 RepID=A0AAJ0C2H9_9PEZI|nr:uncharacterized protein QBC33DRAFT_568413 [Phialemonium atrogriseum]KAK1768730.1 hypothetical protein QBC33DRAFT_568413 [Phialemonium atrogriseum]